MSYGFLNMQEGGQASPVCISVDFLTIIRVFQQIEIVNNNAEEPKPASSGSESAKSSWSFARSPSTQATPTERSLQGPNKTESLSTQAALTVKKPEDPCGTQSSPSTQDKHLQTPNETQSSPFTQTTPTEKSPQGPSKTLPSFSTQAAHTEKGTQGSCVTQSSPFTQATTTKRSPQGPSKTQSSFSTQATPTEKSWSYLPAQATPTERSLQGPSETEPLSAQATSTERSPLGPSKTASSFSIQATATERSLQSQSSLSAQATVRPQGPGGASRQHSSPAALTDPHHSQEENFRKCLLMLSRETSAPKKWKYIGRRLGVSDPDIDQLDCEYSNDIQEAFYQVVRKCRDQKGPQATYDILIAALKEEKYNDAARKLEEYKKELDQLNHS